MKQKIDWPWSEQIAIETGARTKACWLNAARALVAFGPDSGLLYTEGWLIISPTLPIIIEHGWLVRASDDLIIDPTLVIMRDDSDEPEPLYFQGPTYDYQTVLDFIGSGKTPPLIWQTGGWGGMQSSLYADAHAKAHKQAYGYTPDELWSLLKRDDHAS